MHTPLNQPAYRQEFLAGMRASLPLIPGVVPFGILYAASAVSAGMPAAAVMSMSWAVFAGSAQMVAARLFTGGAVWPVILLVTFVINLRHMLYSLALAPRLAGISSRMQALLAYFLTDETFAIASAHPVRPGDPARRTLWYSLGANILLWTIWQASTAAGVMASAQVPASWGLEFVLPLTLIALLIPSLTSIPQVAAALGAGLAAAGLAGLPYRLGLLAAVIIGVLCGLAASRLHPARQSGQARRTANRVKRGKCDSQPGTI
jgi:4-azaleucine resistance transporter AzlC